MRPETKHFEPLSVAGVKNLLPVGRGVASSAVFGAAFGLRSGFVGQAKIKMHCMGEAE
jgi:hypothetical protein